MRTWQFLIVVAYLMVVISQGRAIDFYSPLVWAACALLAVSGACWASDSKAKPATIRRKGRLFCATCDALLEDKPARD